MHYRDYLIERSDVIRLPSGRRRGTLDLFGPTGLYIDSATYTVGNDLSRKAAYRKLADRVDQLIDGGKKDKK